MLITFQQKVLSIIHRMVQELVQIRQHLYQMKHILYQYVRSQTIKLHFTENDALSGTNTIGLSERNGTQKLIVGSPQDTILDLKILNSGSNYSNRTLSISTAGISTFFNSITFENHGFSDGDNIVYSTTGTVIDGLDTNLQYKILKLMKMNLDWQMAVLVNRFN